MNSFYTIEELNQIGFKSIGIKVLISKHASIYSASSISIGDNVRIDDFCILSGNINIGSNIHISAFCALYGAMGIIMEDYTGLSPRTSIFSSMDDFSGDYLIGPIHKSEFTNVLGGIVKIEQFSQIGSGCVIFPNLTLFEGTVVGALSLVNKSIGPWGIYAGIPIRIIKDRKNNLLIYKK